MFMPNIFRGTFYRCDNILNLYDIEKFNFIIVYQRSQYF